MNRRAFLSGLIAAPAVIRVAPLMRIAPVPLYGALDGLWWEGTAFVSDEFEGTEFIFRTSIHARAWRQYNAGVPFVPIAKPARVI